ncbi:MAG: hypothetical protein HY702_02885 [Gemmatimonadetes bacterium]|nr:hypothetical protein [Gemmatimonadota bacterium]
MRRCFRWTLAVAAGTAFVAVAQAIVVAPHVVFLDHKTRSGVLYLYNPSDRPEEVSISFAFGYPASDSAGNVYIRLVEDPETGSPSAAGWIRAFPRRTVVLPGQRQAVRLLAQPPGDLPDGEYWTRTLVTSRAAQPPVTVPDTGVRVGLTLEVRTLIPVMYRKGSLTTGVEVTALTVEPEGDTLAIRVGMKRRGTAAYLGTLELALLDSTGAVRASWEQLVAVYYQLERRLPLSIAGLPAGTYTLDLRLETKRNDIKPEQVIWAEPVHRQLGVRLP